MQHDANGNLLSDGARTYGWDAEDRLVSIAYPAESGKQTAFAYDGLGRRVTISETPTGGGSATTSHYVWCGMSPCQKRDAAYAPVRGYYSEGEYRIGAASDPALYYGIDQIGSARRVFENTSSPPAYDYDPWGNALQTTAPLADYGFAGIFNHAPSRLGLTWFRAYDPDTGRWVSRDPLGEMTDPAGNLYAYVGNEPVNYVDPEGLFPRPQMPNCPSTLPVDPASSPRTGAPWGMWTNGYDTLRIYDGNGNAWYDIDFGHHGRGWEYHMWENGERQKGIRF